MHWPSGVYKDYLWRWLIASSLGTSFVRRVCTGRLRSPARRDHRTVVVWEMQLKPKAM